MRRIALAAALLAAAASMAAASGTVDLAEYGFVKTGQRTIGQNDFTQLADASGGTVLFDAEAEITPERATALRSLVAEARSWQGIKAGEIQAVNSADRLVLTLTPASFEVDGVSLAGAIPGGIRLFFDTAPEYDFKVLSGQYLVRVSGPLSTEAELESTALSAFKDPASFLASRDPAFLRKFLEDSVASLKADVLALKAENEELRAGWEKGRPAIIAALNGGKPVKPEVEDKISDILKDKPELDKAGVAAALKSAGVKASSGEITAILLVDFGRH